MSNPLFHEQMNKGMMNQFSSFMHNPMQFLMQHKLNIPQELSNDPHSIVQHLLNSGQMSQEQLNKLTQQAQKMGIKF